MKQITAVVSRGSKKGTALTPHRYQEGHFLVTKGGNESDFATKVLNEQDLESWIQRGYGVRMSGPGVAPSIYSGNSLRVGADSAGNQS